MRTSDRQRINNEREWRRLAKNWETLAKRDPCWAILSSGHRTLDEFRETGIPEANLLVQRFSEITGRDPSACSAADYGCGIGRLTIPLLGHFESVCGLDISETMLRGAQSYADEVGGAARLTLRHVDLGRAIAPGSTFDLVFANLVLQHSAPQVAGEVLTQLCNAVSETGLLLANFLDRKTDASVVPDGVRRRMHRLVAPVHDASRIEMHALPKEWVVAALAGRGDFEVRLIEDVNACPGWKGYWCVALRAPSPSVATDNPD